MVVIGVSYLLTWLQVEVFNISLVKALLVTAIVFILVGIMSGERPWSGKRPWMRG